MKISLDFFTFFRKQPWSIPSKIGSIGSIERLTNHFYTMLFTFFSTSCISVFILTLWMSGPWRKTNVCCKITMFTMFFFLLLSLLITCINKKPRPKHNFQAIAKEMLLWNAEIAVLMPYIWHEMWVANACLPAHLLMIRSINVTSVLSVFLSPEIQL